MKPTHNEAIPALVGDGSEIGFQHRELFKHYSTLSTCRVDCRPDIAYHSRVTQFVRAVYLEIWSVCGPQKYFHGRL